MCVGDSLVFSVQSNKEKERERQLFFTVEAEGEETMHTTTADLCRHFCCCRLLTARLRPHWCTSSCLYAILLLLLVSGKGRERRSRLSTFAAAAAVISL